MITGYVQKEKSVTGYVSQGGNIIGVIDRASDRPVLNSDHVFIVVDLLKLYASRINVINTNAIVPFTANNIQVIPKNLMINLSTDILTVSSMSATEDEEVNITYVNA